MTTTKINIAAAAAEELECGRVLHRRVADALAARFPTPIRRILLIVPPDGDVNMFDPDTALRQRYYNHPPYGLGIIAALLRQEGYAVELLNLNLLVLEQARANPVGFHFDETVRNGLELEMADFKPELIALTGMYSQSHQALCDTSRLIRSLYPHVPQALGGVHPTSAFDDSLTREALLRDLASVDFIFLHEAENAFLEFLRICEKKTDIEGLSQLVIRVSATEAIHVTTQRRPTAEQIDILPAFDLMNLDRLSGSGRIGAFYALKPPETRFATSQLGRGCRFTCSFCSVRNFNGVGVRSRSVKSVIDELTCLLEEHGVTHIVWLDDDFLADEKRCLDLFDQIQAKRLKFTWDCSNGIVAASVTEELAAGAAASGCIGMYLGVETGSPALLKEVRKPGRPHHFRKAADLIRKHPSIHLRAFLIIGFPNETFGMIKETMELAREMDLDWCHVNMFQPLPSTKLFKTTAGSADDKHINFMKIRFNSGAYGKQERNGRRRTAQFLENFEDVFSGKGLDEIPTSQELAGIWTYLNFHVNFQRLFHEDRPEKIYQNYLYIRNIVDCVDPSNAFAVYFMGYLAWRQTGAVPERCVHQLDDLLSATPDWKNRLDDFGLSPDDLRLGGFPSTIRSLRHDILPRDVG